MLIEDWRTERKRLQESKCLYASGSSKYTRADETVRAAAIIALAKGFPGVALRRLDLKPIFEPISALKPPQALHPFEEEHEIVQTIILNKVIITPEQRIKHCSACRLSQRQAQVDSGQATSKLFSSQTRK